MKNKKSVFKRNDKVWPWGYYIPYRKGLHRGECGLFVASTKQDAIRQVNRVR
jgi:hypothetical protein